MSNADAEMLALFVQEANEHLETLESDLVALESAPDNSDRINRIFRAVHSIKGTAGFFGFAPIVNLAHVMESLMSLVRDGLMQATPAIINHLLAGTDKLNAMIKDPANATAIPSQAEIDALNAFLQHDPPTEAPSAESELPSNLENFQIDPELVRNALKHGHNIFVISLRLHADVEAIGQTPLHYFQEVDSLGTLIDTTVDIGAVGGLDSDLPPDLVCSILFATAMEGNLLLGAFDLPQSQLVQISSKLMGEWLKTQPKLMPRKSVAPLEPLAKPAAAKGKKKPSSKKPSPAPETPAPVQQVPATPSAPKPDLSPVPVSQAPSEANLAVQSSAPSQPETINLPAASAPRHKAEETVRINVSLLDSLMNLAGEMVLSRNQLVRLANPTAGAAPLRDSTPSFRASARSLPTSSARSCALASNRSAAFSESSTASSATSAKNSARKCALRPSATTSNSTAHSSRASRTPLPTSSATVPTTVSNRRRNA